MKILFTGSNGLLGQKICALTTAYPQHTFLATSRGANRTQNLGRAKYLTMDITKRTNVLRVVEEFEPEVIIHGAAMTHVDECELQRDLATLMNVEGTRHIAEAAQNVQAHLILISTDFIFDGKDGPYNEEAIPNPLSHYGKTKLLAENIVKGLTSYSILRTVLVIGVAEDLSRSNIVLWAKRALEQGQPIDVVDDQYRTPTLAEDLAIGTLLAADKKAHGVFNISGPDHMSIYELVKKVAEHFDLSMSNVSKVDSITLNQPAKRPLITGFDISKAQRELGFKPHSFKESLELMTAQAGL